MTFTGKMVIAKISAKVKHSGKVIQCTVVPGFSVLGFRALPGFRALTYPLSTN